MPLRRGFKAEANGFSRDLREEMSVKPHEKLCPWALAEHLEIPIFGISPLNNYIPDVIGYFRGDQGRKILSAVTLFRGMRRTIIHNDAHDPKRQAANIAHELAHALLLHPAKPPFDENGERHYSSELEEEANWLGPALLLSEEAALWIARNGWSIAEASQLYGVSEDLVRMRLNLCGAYKRIRGRAA